MQQEINLFSLLPKEKKSFLTLKLITITYSAFVLILFLNFCSGWWEKHQQRIMADQLNVELNQVQKKLAVMHEQYPMLDSKDMENSLRKLQQELEEKNNIFNLLAKDRRFSNYLLGFAKAATPDLWLVDIEVNLNDKKTLLKGYATKANAIQQFINNITHQSEFSGLNFQVQEVAKVVLNKETLLSFIISTNVNSNNEA